MIKVNPKEVRDERERTKRGMLEADKAVRKRKARALLENLADKDELSLDLYSLLDYLLEEK